MKGEEVTEHNSCSVSHELVGVVAMSDPSRFKDEEGSLKLADILFYLGFKIDNEVKSKGYYVNEDVYIRDNNFPSRVYKTKAVYNGVVRNKMVGYDGYEPIYCRYTRHPLFDLYTQVEVVQPIDINKYIAEEAFESIDDIGEEKWYNEGYLTSLQPAKPTTRNIVRN